MGYIEPQSSKPVILWDRDGTLLTETTSPDDFSFDMPIHPAANDYMKNGVINVVCSGTRIDGTNKDYPPEQIAPQMKALMEHLPRLDFAVFSPDAAGETCFMQLKGGDNLLPLHLVPELAPYVGQFKKPDAGLFHAALFIAGVDPARGLAIGDMPQDEAAAKRAGARYLDIRALPTDSGFVPSQNAPVLPEALPDALQALLADAEAALTQSGLSPEQPHP